MNRMQEQMEQFLHLLQQEFARGFSDAQANPPKGAIVPLRLAHTPTKSKGRKS